jgi:hypothetical protein
MADVEITESGSSSESCTERRAAPGGDLDDVPCAALRKQESTGLERRNPDRTPATIEDHHVDGHPHAERVHGAAAPQHERDVWVQGVATEQPSRPLTTGLRDLEVPTVDPSMPHERTVATRADTQSSTMSPR